MESAYLSIPQVQYVHYETYKTMTLIEFLARSPKSSTRVPVSAKWIIYYTNPRAEILDLRISDYAIL